MYAYEVTWIVDNTKGEDAVNEVIEKYKEELEKQGGSCKQVKTWGRRRFAYEINDRHEGVYVTMHFDAPAEGASELRRLMGYDERVLRTLFVRDN